MSTKVSREVFSEAFIGLGGADRLIKWANGLEGTCTTPKNGDNLKAFYTLFVKQLPKEIKTEDLNKSQENFVRYIQAQEARLKLESGTPAKMIDVSADDVKINTTT